MDKNITTITNIETGLHAPAEIRQYNEKQTMDIYVRLSLFGKMTNGFLAMACMNQTTTSTRP